MSKIKTFIDIRDSLEEVIKNLNFFNAIGAQSYIIKIKSELNILPILSQKLNFPKLQRLIDNVCSMYDVLDLSIQLEIVRIVCECKLYVDACINYLQRNTISPLIQYDIETLKTFRRCFLF